MEETSLGDQRNSMSTILLCSLSLIRNISIDMAKRRVAEEKFGTVGSPRASCKPGLYIRGGKCVVDGKEALYFR